MEKPTAPTSYLLNGNKVEIMSCFVYEVSIYKITKNMAVLMGSQFYKSNKLLDVKEETTIKRFKNHIVIRNIDLLGVPKEFVEENNLPIYEYKLKKKETYKKKKK